MVRKEFYIEEDQIEFLSTLPGTVSEHIRIAIDEYIDRKKREKLQVSESPTNNNG